MQKDAQTGLRFDVIDCVDNEFINTKKFIKVFEDGTNDGGVVLTFKDKNNAISIFLDVERVEKLVQILTEIKKR